MAAIFEQVWIISLKRRSDRLERILSNIDSISWPFRRPKIFWAIDGDKVGVPSYWQTGGGSYGCHRSHIVLLERAIQDDVKSILMIEDDATFPSDFGPRFKSFLRVVPQDWECLMLGGQHVNSDGIPVAPGVVRAGGGGGIQRTHCYGIRGAEPMRALYKVWANAAVHCDWVMGPCMAKFHTYAPDPFLVGQEAGWSDISGSQNPRKLWRSPTGREAVIILRSSRIVMEQLQKLGWHGGNTRDQATGIDVGLMKVFDEFATPLCERRDRLRAWIEMIQWEVASAEHPSVCVIWHPEVTLDLVRPIVRGPLLEIDAASVEEAQSKFDLGENAKKKPRIPVVLLRARREVMEELRSSGFHTGNWRNSETGEDRGLSDALLTTLSTPEKVSKIARVVKILDEEASRIECGIATLWHHSMSADLLDNDEFDVLELSASNAAEAVAKRMIWARDRAIDRGF